MRIHISSRIPEAIFLSSRTNPLVVSLAKLAQAKHRREQGLFLAEGVKLAREAAVLPETRYILIASDDGCADEEILEIAASRVSGAEVVVLPVSTFSKISTENAPQGVIAILSVMPRLHRAVSGSDAGIARGERLIAVDGVQDPGNLGTILRTARAFGYRCVLLGGCADIYHPRTVRAAMGALFHMEIAVCEDLRSVLAALRAEGRRVLSAALGDNSLPLGKTELLPDDCVVIGNEGHGVSPAILHGSDAALRIPMQPGCESLNAAGAAAVLMWEYYRTFGA